MMNETIKLLAGGISAIIPPEYIGQKLIESGTGILWKKLKKRLEGDNNAVGAGLYDAIEHSVEAYAHTHNKDDIAVCCEKLYFEWMQNNSLKDDSIKKALSTLSAQPIGDVQVETWKSFLDREIVKNEELRNWIDHKSIENINPKLDYIIQELKEMPVLLKKCEIPEEVNMDIIQKNYSKHLFLSYSSNDLELADRIDYELTNQGVDVKRDIRDIGAWRSIKEFMSLIREQDYAVMVISKSYLKSPNCMYEVLEIFKDAQYKDKILSVVTSDADIYNPISRANYIKYWEEETKKLEETIKTLKLENISELTIDLRKYKLIETTIASFLDLIADKNNPKVVDAIEKIQEIVCSDKIISSKTRNDNKKEYLDIKVEACHYAFQKYEMSMDVSDTKLENMIGIKKLSDSTEQNEYDLPMLICEVINCSNQERIIQEPCIEGNIKLNENEVDAVGFFIIDNSKKRLAPGSKACFTLNGVLMVSIIQALFAGKIKSIYVEDNFGFRYNVKMNELEKITDYFKKYCSNLDELKEKYSKYGNIS